MKLTEEQWRLVQPLLTPPIRTGTALPPPKRGRPLIDDRPVLEAILTRLSLNLPWYDLPASSPSWQTCYHRYRRWSRQGVMRQVLSHLYHDLLHRGGLDLSTLFQDGLFELHRENGQLRFHIAPHWRGAWQLDTAMIFVWLSVKRIEKKHLTNRISPLRPIS